MNPLRTRLVAAAVGVGLVIAAPTAAWAAPRRPVSTATAEDTTDARRSIEDLRARCIAAVDIRLPALAAGRKAVSDREHVSDDHLGPLTADIDGTAARLRTLADLIKADTDLAAMREHCRSIFEGNRVFALVLPRARLVVGADTATNTGAKLADVAARLADAIATAEAAGQDVGQAKLDLEMMQAAIASGAVSAGGVAPAVMGLTPADWNADHEVLASARQSLRSARADLKVARDLAHSILNGIRPAPGRPQV